jgi:hypothetical protein
LLSWSNARQKIHKFLRERRQGKAPLICSRFSLADVWQV